MVASMKRLLRQAWGATHGRAIATVFVALATTIGTAHGSGATGARAASRPATIPSAADLRGRLDSLRRQLDRYRVGGDLRTHLFFRHADRPTLRATLASLIAAESALRNVAAEADRDVTEAYTVLDWCEAALARLHAGPAPKVSPSDRSPPVVCLDGGLLRAGPTPPIVTGWCVSDASGIGGGNAAECVDLAACLGARMFLDARSDVTKDIAEALAVRAAFLGVAYHDTPPASGLKARDGRDAVLHLPSDARDPAAADRWRLELWSRAVRGDRVMAFAWEPSILLRPWLVEATAFCGLGFARLGDVLRYFPGRSDILVVGSPPKASQTAEALADAQVPADVAQIEALADADRMGHCRLLILAGVEDADPSVRDAIRRFRDAGNVLLAVGPCLRGVPRTGPGGIPLDLHVEADRYDPLCAYVRRLRDRGTILADQIVPSAADGGPVKSLRTRTVRDETGRILVYLANGSDVPRPLILRHRGMAVAQRAEELIAGGSLEPARSPVVLPPFAVWLLRLPGGP